MSKQRKQCAALEADGAGKKEKRMKYIRYIPMYGRCERRKIRRAEEAIEFSLGEALPSYSHAHMTRRTIDQTEQTRIKSSSYCLRRAGRRKTPKTTTDRGLPGGWNLQSTARLDSVSSRLKSPGNLSA